MQEEPNLSYIEKLADGDHAFKNRLLAIIKEELPQEVASFKENLSQRKFALAADGVHKLKHKISILGLESSYAKAEQFEEELRQENIVGLAQFEITLSTMQTFIDKCL